MDVGGIGIGAWIAANSLALGGLIYHAGKYANRVDQLERSLKLVEGDSRLIAQFAVQMDNVIKQLEMLRKDIKEDIEQIRDEWKLERTTFRGKGGC